MVDFRVGKEDATPCNVIRDDIFRIIGRYHKQVCQHRRVFSEETRNIVDRHVINTTLHGR